MEFDALLRLWKHRRHMTTQELSVRSGVPKGTINKILTGETKNPTVQTMRLLSDALEIPAGLVMSEEPMQSELVRGLEVKRVPVLGEIAAGKPILCEQADEYIAVPDGDRFDHAIRVRGDSMIGASICSGDLVLIRDMPDVDDGEIAAVIIDDSASLKRVYHTGEGLTLISENPKYPPMFFDKSNCDSLRILGKAVCVMKNL